MITFKKYGVAEWKHVRNNFTFRRCNETKERIWPWQLMYGGMSAYTYPGTAYCTAHWLKPDAYLVLKLKGEV